MSDQRGLAPVSSSGLSVNQASQLAKNTPALARNTEPGFANTYGPGSSSPGGLLESAVPAAGIGMLGLLMLYRRRLQDQQDQDREKQSGLDELKAQLPGLHAKDMLLGGALGGGAGLLYDLAKGAPKGQRFRSALTRILTGAGIGAAGANVLGDRFRRYHSNVMIPAGYDAAEKAKQLVPKSVQQFLQAAIYDKPAFDPKDLADFQGKYFDKNIANTVLGARRELNRIAQGVHTKQPATDYWQKNKGSGGNPDYYSLNERNQNYDANVGALFGPQVNPTFQSLLKNPDAYIATENSAKAPWQTTGLFGADTLLGGQQVIAARDGKRLTGRVLDRYDMTPSRPELQEASEAVKKLHILNPFWWMKQREKTPGDYNAPDTTNAGFMANLLSRLAWDRVLTEEHPWVSQQFSITPGQDASWMPWRKAQPGQLQLQNEAGN